MILRSRLVAASLVVLSLAACGPETRLVPNLSGAWLGQMTVTSSEKTAVLTIDGGLSIDDGKAAKEWPVGTMPTVNSVTFGECAVVDQQRSSDSVIALSVSCSAPEIGFTYCSSGRTNMLSATGTVAVAASSATLSLAGSIVCDQASNLFVPVAITGTFKK